MDAQKIASSQKWLTARKALLAKEKEFTQARDALNAERRKLPMVRIDKDYVFEGPEGKVKLLNLFEGRRHGFGDSLWVRARVTCAHDNRRRHHFRILANGQPPHRD